jgi:predicted SAM-dependent methyltransferase/GT2 family glycosyltransferase
MKIRLYILLPVYNRRNVTEVFVKCLATQTFTNFHLVLIDDGSVDGTSEMVRSKVDDLTVLTGDGGLWWAGSLQLGLDWLNEQAFGSEDVVLIANDDITFDEHFLENSLEAFMPLNRTLLLSRNYEDKTGRVEESGIHANLDDFTFQPATHAEQINCLSTRALFIKANDLKNIGGFHPKLLPHYWSDYEFTMRAGRKGFKLVTSEASVIGVNHQTSGYRGFDNAGFCTFLSAYFSKKSVLNPIYKTTFMCMAGSGIQILKNVPKFWLSSISYIARQARKRLCAWVSNRRIMKAIHAANSLKVIVGSASTSQPGWVSTNYPLLDLTDKRTFGTLFRHDQVVERFLAEHVWEHLTEEGAAMAARNCADYLREGGVLRIAVPDGYHPDPDYIAQVKPGGYGPGADDHKVLYNYRSLTRLLQENGFEPNLLEWFDETGVFHAREWSPDDGMIQRSSRYDPRNKAVANRYTSLIIDAVKVR